MLATRWKWVLGTVIVLCGPDVNAVAQQPADPVKEHHYFKKSEHNHEVKWGYSGKIGPTHWGMLSPDYRLASEGKRQSPIDIVLDEAGLRKLAPLKFAYRKERVAVFNNGHTIQHDDKPGSFLHVGDKVYALEQFHVHLPSEHTINGRHAAMEIHLVHKSNSGEVAVVAVLVQPGREKPVVVPPLTLPAKQGEQAKPFRGEHNPVELLPTNRVYVTYQGSFTTPPCTEGVRWIVLTTPIQATAGTIAKFRQATGGNNRPVQKRNGRDILLTQDDRDNDK